MNLNEVYEAYKNFKIPSLSEIREIASQHSKTSLLIVILLVVLLLSALQYIPHYQVSHFNITNQKDLADAENSYRATLAQIFGGIAIAIGLYYTWRRIAIAEEDLKATQKTLEVAQEGQITERFTRAIDQLGAVDKDGNPAIEIRLGGIYALERIANESEKDYWPAMEILTAYVRKNSPVETAEKQEKVSLDIQAILTIIGRCIKFRENGVYMDLSGTNLKKSNLRDSYLEYALFGEANLEEARLSNAYLKGSYFRKANLKGANLPYTQLEDTNFKEANLERANFQLANLDNTTFWKANLYKARLIHVNLEGINFYNANLEGAKLGKRFDNIPVTSLKMAHLVKANFMGADLNQVNLQEARLQEADFKGADLRLANLKGANLKEANLEDSDLSGEYYDMFFPEKSYKGASLVNANLEGVNLKGANLEYAKLLGAKNLTVEQLSKAKTLYQAQLDKELEDELRAEGFGYLIDNEPKDEP